MSNRDQRALLLVAGVGLIAVGDKLLDAELGKLGLPHVVATAMVSLALRL